VAAPPFTQSFSGSSLWTVAFGHHEDRTPTHGYEGKRAKPPWLHLRRVGGGNEIARRAPAAYLGPKEELKAMKVYLDTPGAGRLGD